MSRNDSRGSTRAAALGAAGLIAAVILVNVAVRLLPLPDLDLDVGEALPDLPGWLKVVLRVKNVLIALLVLGLLAAVALERHDRRRPAGRDDA